MSRGEYEKGRGPLQEGIKGELIGKESIPYIAKAMLGFSLIWDLV